MSKNAVRKLGQYQLIKKLGEGGMGAVYLGEDTLMQRKVAIKILPRKSAADAQFLARFKREAQAAGNLNHENICGAFAVGEDQGHHYYVMEYLTGQSLGDRIKAEKRIACDEAIQIIMQAAEGLQYAHQNGFVHRDIKPDNIMLTADGVAKVLDLGLTKNIESEGQDAFLTQDGSAIGTPHYISPEQARGERDVDGRTDIYSLGATFYCMVTGSKPFEGPTAATIMLKHLQEQAPNPRDLNGDIPTGVVQVIRRMMGRDPADRYADCEELLEDLELILDGQEPTTPHLDARKSAVAGAKRLPMSARGRRTTGPREPVGERRVGRRASGAREAVGRSRSSSGRSAIAVRPDFAEGTGGSRRKSGGGPVFIGLGVLGAVVLLAVLFGSGSDPKPAPKKTSRKTPKRSSTKTHVAEVKPEQKPDAGTPQVAVTPKRVLPETAKESSEPKQESKVVTKKPVAPAQKPSGDWITILNSADDLSNWWCNKAQNRSFSDGCLRLRGSTYMRHRKTRGRDMMLRATVKKLGGESLTFSMRGGKGGTYVLWFNGRNTFGIGLAGRGKFRNLRTGKSTRAQTDFFELTFSAIGNVLTVHAEGEQIIRVEDDQVGAGSVGLGVHKKGDSLFRNVQVRLLDGNGETTVSHAGEPANQNTGKKSAGKDPARAALAIYLQAFDVAAMKGDINGARKVVEKATADARLKAMGRELKALSAVASVLEKFDKSRQEAIVKLVGRSVRLETKKGVRKGKVLAVEGNVLRLVSTFVINNQTKTGKPFEIRMSDLTSKAQDQLFSLPRPGNGNEWIAEVIRTLGAEAFEQAEKALKAAGGHPLAGHYRAQLGKVRAAEREAAAQAVWKRDFEPLLALKKLDKKTAQETDKALRAFIVEHTKTAPELMASQKEAIRKIESLIASTLGGASLANLKKIFSGEIRKFNPNTFEIELFYDFEDARQQNDWRLSTYALANRPRGAISIQNGTLRMMHSASYGLLKGIFHSVEAQAEFEIFNGFGDAFLICNAQDAGYSLGVMGLQAKRYMGIYKMPAGRWQPLEKVPSVYRDTRKGKIRIQFSRGVLQGQVGEKVFKANVAGVAPGHVGFFAYSTQTAYDNLHIKGVLDRKWLETALAGGQPAGKQTEWDDAIDLLPLIDPQKDAVAGKWQRNEKGRLISAPTPRSRIEIPYLPPKEYDFLISFTRTGGASWVGQLASKDGHAFGWFMRKSNGHEFGQVKGSSQRISSPAQVRNWKTYTSIVKVRQNGVTTYLDDKQIYAWKPSDGPLSPYQHWRLRDDKLLGLATSSPTIFKRVLVREVTGKGTFTRGAPKREATVKAGKGSGPTNGLIAHWTFDEGKGTTARDTSGNNRHGTLVGGPKWVKGQVGGALQFSKGQDVVSISGTFDPPKQGTVAFWICPAGTGRILGGHDAWEAVLLQNSIISNHLWVTGGRTLQSSSRVPLGKWFHVAMTYDATTNQKTIHLNGELNASANNLNNTDPGSFPLTIGTRTGRKEFFPGILDDVRIYNRVLSAEEIKALATPEANRGAGKDRDGAGANRPDKSNAQQNALARYRFNHGSDAKVRDSAGKDRSHHLNIANGKRVRWGPEGLTIHSPTVVTSQAIASLVQPMVRNKALTIEVGVTVNPKGTVKYGRILELEMPYPFQLMVFPTHRDLRFIAGGDRKMNGCFNNAPAHILISIKGSTCLIYVNGKQRSRSGMSSDLWKELSGATKFRLGNSKKMNRALCGTYHCLAFYSHAMTEQQVKAQYQAFKDRIAKAK